MAENDKAAVPEPTDESNQGRPDRPTPDQCYSKDSCHKDRKLIRAYRVFISYSHRDTELAEQLAEHLKSAGLLPITDHEIRIGETFSEEIREMIECVHVFMPLVTQDVDYRQWVQQEIGYAMALHVPVCPIAIGSLPAGMTEQIQGIHIGGSGSTDAEKAEFPDVKTVMDRVRERLNYEAIDDLVERARRRTGQGRYDCALCWTEREERLIELTNAARRQSCDLLDRATAQKPFDRHVRRLRQRTAFGSFSIPDTTISSDAWRVRDPDRYHTEQHRRLLREERRVMSKYMECFGCDLIIDPRVTIRKNPEAHEAPVETPDAGKEPETIPNTEPLDAPGRTTFKHSRLRTAFRVRLLIDLVLRHIEDDMLRIVIPPHPGSMTTNLMIVGDWFATEAVVPHYRGGGYERTMFTRHAPTVLNMIERFDRDFRDCLPNPNAEDDRVQVAKENVLADLRHWKTGNEEDLSALQKKDLNRVCSELDLKTE